MATAAAQGTVIKVRMSQIGYAQPPDVLETLLGSCVGIALWDPTTKLGGLAHVVLPESHGKTDSAGKYADTAVAALRSELVRKGALPLRLTAKLAGGARMFGTNNKSDVGSRNYEAVTAELARHKIAVVGEHVGGNQGRVLSFDVYDGSVAIEIARAPAAVL